jgi:hypothetical protein
LPVHRECGRGEAIADDSAAGGVMQIINPLGFGMATIYSMAWVWKALDDLESLGRVRRVRLVPVLQRNLLNEVAGTASVVLATWQFAVMVTN